MNIVVLLKQVPDTESFLQIAEDRKDIKKGDIKWIINPYDEYAVEEALAMKESAGGTVTVISVGPEKTTEAIRSALAMGADSGILVTDSAISGSDALGIARILVSVITSLDFDLLIAGQRAVDDDGHQVGAYVAALLQLPQISMVIKTEIEADSIVCDSVVEGATVKTRTKLPALITATKGLNEPRYASMMGIMKAKKKPIVQKSLADLDLDSSLVGPESAKIRVRELFFPPDRKDCRIIEGESVDEKASALLKLLSEEARVL